MSSFLSRPSKYVIYKVLSFWTLLSSLWASRVFTIDLPSAQKVASGTIDVGQIATALTNVLTQWHYGVKAYGGNAPNLVVVNRIDLEERDNQLRESTQIASELESKMQHYLALYESTTEANSFLKNKIDALLEENEALKVKKKPGRKPGRKAASGLSSTTTKSKSKPGPKPKADSSQSGNPKLNKDGTPRKKPGPKPKSQASTSQN